MRLTVLDAASDTFATLDRALAGNPRFPQVTCRKGCAACCYQLALCGIAEGYYIAASLPGNPREWVRLLVPAARAACELGLSRRDYFDRQTPCVFLTPGRTCGIYAHRPAACRYHVVVSPPENCSPGAKDPTTARLNTERLLLEAARLSNTVHMERPDLLGPPAQAPIPLMVLAAFRVWGTEGLDRFTEKRMRGLPTPQEWMDAHDPTTLFPDGLSAGQQERT